MKCTLILYVGGGTYNLTVAANAKFLSNFSMAILFYSQIFCQKSAESKLSKKYFYIFILMPELGFEFGPLISQRTTYKTPATSAENIVPITENVSDNSNFSVSQCFL